MRRGAAQSDGDRRLIGGVLLGAGRSIRFGRQKLLESWKGEPMIRHAARTWIESGLVRMTVVISQDPRLRNALTGLPIGIIENPQPERGISSSIALAIAGLGESVDAALIGVADQPLLTADALRSLVAAFAPGEMVAARYGDHVGNPMLFDRRFFAELLELKGDRGGQQLLAAHPDDVIEVDLPQAMGEDIDRPEQWPT
jgi:molybdenum cofactor cytidylyltransferase